MMTYAKRLLRSFETRNVIELWGMFLENLTQSSLDNILLYSQHYERIPCNTSHMHGIAYSAS